MSDTDKSEAATIADLAVRAHAITQFELRDGRIFVAHPEDVALEEVTDPHGLIVPPPARIVQKIILQTVDSLVGYVESFKTDTTAVFADIDKNTIVALVDYHGPANPQHVSHRATLQLQHSVEWKAWNEISNKLMDQKEFARFLEENAADIVAPTGADLLEIARDLQAVRTADFRRVVRTNGDDESFEYTEGTEAKTKNGAVEVPSKFKLEIPVYFGEANTGLFAFLRWKLDEGKLLMGIKLHRPEHVRQAVFKQIVLDIGGRTYLHPVFGRVEP